MKNDSLLEMKGKKKLIILYYLYFEDNYFLKNIKKLLNFKSYLLISYQ
jgi:hypothetical protein